MKKVFFLFMILLSVVISANGQSDSLKKDSIKSQSPQSKSDLIWVRESDIPPSALANLQRDSRILDVEDDIEKIGEYVSIGREIGGAIDTSLSAIAYHADNISQTFVGKFTMLMIAWKVLGADLVDKIFDVLVLIAWVLIWAWSFRRNFSRRKMATEVQIIPWRLWFKHLRRRKVIDTEYFDPSEENVCGGNCPKTCEVKDARQTSYWVHIILGLLVFIILLLITLFG